MFCDRDIVGRGVGVCAPPKMQTLRATLQSPPRKDWRRIAHGSASRATPEPSSLSTSGEKILRADHIVHECSASASYCTRPAGVGMSMAEEASAGTGGTPACPTDGQMALGEEESHLNLGAGAPAQSRGQKQGRRCCPERVCTA